MALYDCFNKVDFILGSKLFSGTSMVALYGLCIFGPCTYTQNKVKLDTEKCCIFHILIFYNVRKQCITVYLCTY